ncbi:MAG: hypothetical protein JNM48_01115 [Rhodospirillales bacterium]|nr:hypothetical protein [Rhodospirillales bacterium]
MTDDRGDEPGLGGLTSPACAMREADDVYMGFASAEELGDFLQELLEAERAGARVALESARGAPTDEIARLMQMVHRDEARWCAMLAAHIKRLGRPPSTRVGSFHGKAMAIADPFARIDFLNRGQGWVVRRLREMLPRLRDEALHQDLSAMLQAHEANIALAAGIASQRPSA